MAFVPVAIAAGAAAYKANKARKDSDELKKKILTSLLGADHVADLETLARLAYRVNNRLMAERGSGVAGGDATDGVASQTDVVYGLLLAVVLNRTRRKITPPPPPRTTSEHGDGDRQRLLLLKEVAYYYRYACIAYGPDCVREEAPLWPNSWPQPATTTSTTSTTTTSTTVTVATTTKSSAGSSGSSSTSKSVKKFKNRVISSASGGGSSSDSDGGRSGGSGTINTGDNEGSDVSVGYHEDDDDNEDEKARKRRAQCAAALVVDPTAVLLIVKSAMRLHPALVVVMNEDKEELVVAVRGTKQLADVIADGLLEAKYDEKLRATVHSGMLQAARNAINTVKPLVDNAFESKKIKRVVCVGHSLGAGVAALLSLELADELGDDRVRCIAVAPPAMLGRERNHDERSMKIITAVACADDIVVRSTATNLLRTQRAVVRMLKSMNALGESPAARLLRLVAAVGSDNAEKSAPGLATKTLEKVVGKQVVDMRPPDDVLQKLDQQLLADVSGGGGGGNAADSDVFATLAPPGRLLWLQRHATSTTSTTDTTGDDSDSDGDEDDSVYVARDIGVDSGNELPVVFSEHMLADHLTGAYGTALRAALLHLGVPSDSL
eukprot:CAMPEP_0198317668 /NCGR_PEP_ID=MMETSP1450-20131203/7106_1 /TAXON_ID=753684 ORGANISM="Madagascaria erythrocladiodes, Strain CCMP3234" /NCGR_SAMPLE_ID=MMETSP1450 /ASSEMBLY_ACC=CAM_ASM_001115 /LENGTH=607 /DNA_ID=CAMNT_0044020897 /DNA_START=58 /DNA_END=1881 /DNA_ORIENTATION=-